MDEEWFPLVDEAGNIVGRATRRECHDGSKRLHPVVHLHIYNKDGDLFLQKRSLAKDIQPGKWDTAVGGHVDLGESVEQAWYIPTVPSMKDLSHPIKKSSTMPAFGVSTKSNHS